MRVKDLCEWPRRELAMGRIQGCPAEASRGPLCPVHGAIVRKPACELSLHERAEIELAFKTGAEWEQYQAYVRALTLVTVAACDTRDRIGRLYAR